MASFSEVSAVGAVSIIQAFDYHTDHKTALIVGLAQGGTSMVAAVVDALGVPCGHSMWNFEGQQERPSVRDQTFLDWAANADAWNLRADAWGTKDTLIWRYSAPLVHSRLRNPYYLIASRDVAAIMPRRQYSNQLATEISLVLAEHTALWNWVADIPPAPVAVVSYERALRDREATCRSIAEFLKVSPTRNEVVLAVSRIGLRGGYASSDGGKGPIDVD
jgi:hypothetical protein